MRRPIHLLTRRVTLGIAYGLLCCSSLVGYAQDECSTYLYEAQSGRIEETHTTHPLPADGVDLKYCNYLIRPAVVSPDGILRVWLNPPKEGLPDYTLDDVLFLEYTDRNGHHQTIYLNPSYQQVLLLLETDEAYLTYIYNGTYLDQFQYNRWVLDYEYTAPSIEYHYDGSGNRIQRLYSRVATSSRDFEDSGLEAEEREVTVVLYPNPTDGQLWIRFPDWVAEELAKDQVRVQVFDATGQLVGQYHKTLEQESRLDLSALPIGRYYVKINIAGHSQTKQIIKT